MKSYETALWWLAASSTIFIIAAALVVPMLLVRIPSDYFTRTERRRKPWADIHPIIRAMLMIGKNTLGFILVAAGIVMLVLPGQGILTIFAGIMLLDFPGKHPIERWIISRPPVLRSINWLRQRDGRPPLVPEE